MANNVPLTEYLMKEAHLAAENKMLRIALKGKDNLIDLMQAEIIGLRNEVKKHRGICEDVRASVLEFERRPIYE